MSAPKYAVEPPRIDSVVFSPGGDWRIDAGFLLNEDSAGQKVGTLFTATVGARFKRTYLDWPGIPFFQPSQINELDPEPARWIAPTNQKHIDGLRAKHRSLQITCSGTVGDVALVGRTMADKVFSHDLITAVQTAGTPIEYLYAYLKTEAGQSALVGNNYGSVIQHIEPNHLLELSLPIGDSSTIQAIADDVATAQRLLDVSNDLIAIARRRLLAELAFPSPLVPYSPVETRTIGLAGGNPRLDGSFYDQDAAAIEAHLVKNFQTVSLGDPAVSASVVMSKRFKRVYVDSNNGVPFIGGKEISQLDPRTDKHLSKVIHANLLPGLMISPNQLLLTCSGSIGQVAIAPSFWSNFSASQHLLRVNGASPTMAGYLYTWLSSDFGRTLVAKHTYGSVIDEIDDEQLSSVLVPLLPVATMDRIGSLVLRANEHRTQAFKLEQAAIRLFESKVLNIV